MKKLEKYVEPKIGDVYAAVDGVPMGRQIAQNKAKGLETDTFRKGGETGISTSLREVSAAVLFALTPISLT